MMRLDPCFNLINRKSVLTGCLLLFAYLAMSQNAEFEFNRYTISDGLPHSNVNVAIEDRQGLMWFETEEGLTRYDGHEFRDFNTSPSTSNIILGRSKNPVVVIQDSQSNIWFNSIYGGITRYNPADNAYWHYYHIEDSLGALSNNNVTACIEDRSGNIWLGTHDGVNLFDRNRQSFKNIKLSESTEDIANFVNCLYEDRAGNIWVGTRNGLYVIDQAGKEISRYIFNYPESKFSKNPLRQNWISALLEDQKGDFWVGTEGFGMYRLEKIEVEKSGLIRYKSSHFSKNRDSGDIISFIKESSNGTIWMGTYDGIGRVPAGYSSDRDLSFFLVGKNDPKLREENFISSFVEDFMGRIWLGTSHGLALFKNELDRPQVILHDPLNLKSLSSSTITNVYQDSRGILWITTTKGGISSLDLRRKKFHSFKYLSQNHPLNPSDVYTIAEDLQNNIWIGSANGLDKYDKNLQNFKHYKTQASNGGQNNVVGVISIDPKGRLWMGFYDGQLASFDPVKEAFTYFSYSPIISNSIVSWSVRSLLFDQSGDLYLGACTGGLGKLKTETGKFQYFMPDSTDWSNLAPINQAYNTINDIEIRSLFQDESGTIWIGTVVGGLNRYDPMTNTFTHYISDANDPTTISSNTVLSIYQDQQKRLWMSTKGGGLNLFDKEKKSFTHLTKTDGLPSNTVFGILEDDKGNLWLSTTHGISKYDPLAKSFRNYTESDGLSANEFNPGAYFKNEEGWMYFGSVAGITYFHPDSIGDDQIAPKVIMTQFRIFNKAVNRGDVYSGIHVLDRDISYAKEINISYRESSIAFDFVGLHYGATASLTYAYRMAPFDKQWIYTTTNNRTASYTNLDPGNYTFTIKAANADGLWSEDPATIVVHIRPPFWATWWFKLLSLFLFIFTLIGIYRLRTHTLRRQKKALALEVARQTTEVLIQKKEIEDQYKNIRILSEIGQKIVSKIQLEELFENIYEQLNELMDADHFAIGLINEANTSVEYITRSKEDAFTTTNVLSMNEPGRLSLWCIQNQQAIFINDMQSEQSKTILENKERYLADNSPKSLMYLPLWNISQEVIGLLVVKSHHKNSYTTVHFDILKNLASYISIALENADSYRAIEIQKEEIQSMSMQVHEADQSKIRFFSNISHEFRTPLTLILGYIDQFRDKNSMNLSKNETGTFDIIKRNADRILKLVDQLLETRDLDQGHKKFSPTQGDLVLFVKSIFDSFSLLAGKFEIQLQFKTKGNTLITWFDQDVLEKIIYNLLSNALKYTPNQGTVSVSIELLNELEHESGSVQITVKDTGIGIPKEHIEQVFDRFFTLESSLPDRENSHGIGLSMVKELVSLHQGKIYADSEIDQGSCFTVILPLSNLEATMDTPKEKLPVTFISSDSNMALVFDKLLIVEDNTDLRKFLKDGLSPHYQIIEAINGVEALDMIEKEQPDMIVSDVMMPMINGIELCKRVKSTPSSSHIPIVLLTAKSTHENQLEGLVAGADDYITKPFSIELLIVKINNILNGRKATFEHFKNNPDALPTNSALNEHDKKFLKDLVMFIKSNLDNLELDVHMLVQHLGMSKTNIYQKVKHLTGMSVNIFIRSIRLQTAQSMLKSQKYNVSEVSNRCGFSQLKYFSSCFKEEFGFPPSDLLK